VLTFDKDKQQFLDPSDSEDTKAMNVEQLRAAESGTGLFDDHMKFVRSLVVDPRYPPRNEHLNILTYLHNN